MIFNIERDGIWFPYHGDEIFWRFPHCRGDKKKYISLLSEGEFDSLAEIDKFWDDWFNELRRKKGVPMLNIEGYDIYFVHLPKEEGVVVTEQGREKPYKGKTECIIEKDKEPVGYGVTTCSVNDKYVKAVGRKISLSRAISIFDKDFRAKVWKAYFEVTKK